MPFKPAHSPDLAQASKDFSHFCETIAMLRDPENGCAWDLQQTHKSLKRYLLEEAYEVLRAIDDEDTGGIQEELGDVLLQVVLHAQLAHDAKQFSVVDVIKGIDEKMRRRHPHVFLPKDGNVSAADVPKQWEILKAQEKKSRPASSAGVESYFEKQKIEKILPPSEQALAIGKAAKKINFDWQNPAEVMAQFKSEVAESVQAFEQFEADASLRPALVEELSDVYFSLAQLCRHLDLHPDVVADAGNRKFLKRFHQMEGLAAPAGINVETAGQKLLEELWLKAKKLEKSYQKDERKMGSVTSDK